MTSDLQDIGGPLTTPPVDHDSLKAIRGRLSSAEAEIEQLRDQFRSLRDAVLALSGVPAPAERGST